MESWKYLGKSICHITLITEDDEHSFYKSLLNKDWSINTSKDICVRETHQVRYTSEEGCDCGKPECTGKRTLSWELRSISLPAQTLLTYVMLGKSLNLLGLCSPHLQNNGTEKDDLSFPKRDLLEPAIKCSDSYWWEEQNSDHSRIWLQ